MFSGQNVTSQTQQSYCLSPATVFPSPDFSLFPEKILGALCLCPPHSASHLACSSPLDGAKPGASVRTRGATRHLRPHPLPHTGPGLHHGRSRVTPTGNPDQFGTCLCTNSALHTKPKEALALVDFCPVQGRGTEVQPGEDVKCPHAGREKLALLGWGKTRLKHGHPHPRSLHIGLSHPEPCLDVPLCSDLHSRCHLPLET